MSSPRSALLTNSNREYLRGNSDPSNESEYRKRIRKRVYDGLVNDGKILSEVGPDLRRSIFREWENRDAESQPNGPTIPKEGAMPALEKFQLEYGIEGLLKFLYLGVEESALSDFEDVLESAIDSTAREHGQYVANLELNIEFGDLMTLKELHQQIKDEELDHYDLTHEEIPALVESGLMDPEEFPDDLQERFNLE